MKIAIVGTGYVGLVTGSCLAEMGNDVTCIDLNQMKIDFLNKGRIPFFEPQLEIIVKKNLDSKRLRFTSDSRIAIKNSSIIFIAVGTPQLENGSANMDFVYEVAKEIAKNLVNNTIIVLKSTVTVGACEKVQEIIKSKNKNKKFHIVNNPEFLKEGNAVNDFMNPDRIIIGSNSEFAINKMKEVYAPFNMKQNRIIIMGNKEAELTKYAANSMLATKISFINEISLICDKLGIDIEDIRKGIGSDKRIGYSFIYPGCGYGGSCFPKDVNALISKANEIGIDPVLLRSTNERNESQKLILVNKINNFYANNLKGKRFAVWGLSFKPNTSDIREAPSLLLIDKLLKLGCELNLYDPVSNNKVLEYFGENKFLSYFEDPYEALKRVDAMILLTEWKMFRNLNFTKLKSNMKKYVIFDGRNQYDPAILKEKGIIYIAIGRSNISG